MKQLLAAAVTLIALTAHGQTLRVVPVKTTMDLGLPGNIQFYCDKAYNRNECVKDISKLRRGLAQYPVGQLGPWSFVVASSDDWKEMMRKMDGDPRSPAFTLIDQRVTVFEEALFITMPLRDIELLQTFSATGDALLRLAITHELGHAVCHELDEKRAEDFAMMLREGRNPECDRAKSNLVSTSHSPGN